MRLRAWSAILAVVMIVAVPGTVTAQSGLQGAWRSSR